jgi:hypothetical protein
MSHLRSSVVVSKKGAFFDVVEDVDLFVVVEGFEFAAAKF